MAVCRLVAPPPLVSRALNSDRRGSCGGLHACSAVTSSEQSAEQ